MKAKLIGIAGIVILIFGCLALQAGGHLPFLDKLIGNINPFKPKPTIITLSDAIITDITRVKQLATTVYTLQQLITKEGELPKVTVLGKYTLARYRMMMIVKGTVEAGLDLNQLKASNISLSEDGKSITLHLPPVTILTEPEYILSNNFDETYVYDFWSEINSAADPQQIETEMRSQAGGQLLQIACDDGILGKATDDARAAIERLLKTTEPDFNIIVVSAPVPTCPPLD